jgi:hypothetical protein
VLQTLRTLCHRRRRRRRSRLLGSPHVEQFVQTVLRQPTKREVDHALWRCLRPTDVDAAPSSRALTRLSDTGLGASRSSSTPDHRTRARSAAGGHTPAPPRAQQVVSLGEAWRPRHLPPSSPLRSGLWACGDPRRHSRAAINDPTSTCTCGTTGPAAPPARRAGSTGSRDGFETNTPPTRPAPTRRPSRSTSRSRRSPRHSVSLPRLTAHGASSAASLRAGSVSATRAAFAQGRLPRRDVYVTKGGATLVRRARCCVEPEAPESVGLIERTSPLITVRFGSRAAQASRSGVLQRNTWVSRRAHGGPPPGPRRSGASRRRSWPWPETKLERKARELSVDGEDLRWWLRVEIERRRGETYAQVPGEPRRDCRSIVLRRRGPECVSARRCAGHQS